MDQAPVMHHFQIVAIPNGVAKVTVDDTDLSGHVGAVGLRCLPGEPPRLTVELVGSGAEVEGMADVTFVRRQDDFVTFLSNIDPDELEAEAIGRLTGFDDKTATAAILDVLKEWGAGL